MSIGGGKRYLVHKIRVDPHLQIMERLGEIMSAVRPENLCCPLKYLIMTAPSVPVAYFLGLENHHSTMSTIWGHGGSLKK